MSGALQSGGPAALNKLNRSMVKLRSTVPEDAFTAAMLGTQRLGNGIIINASGLVLTIGYLVTEATDIWLTTHSGKEFAGHCLAYDQVTGFGLIAPLGKMDGDALTLGDSNTLVKDSEVLIVSHRAFGKSLQAKVFTRRDFAGAWEYLLEAAIFTIPAHTHWSGAALIDAQGLLVGVGSLLVRETVADNEMDANVFVPIDLLKPILNDLQTRGMAVRDVRPWLGIYAAEMKHKVFVAGVAVGGPAQQAKVREGDLIAEIAGVAPTSLAQFYRTLWAQGSAGVSVPLTVIRDGMPLNLQLDSIDRNALLRKPQAH